MTALVDTNVFCGHWPFRVLEHRTPEALKAHLEAHGVEQAWVASAEAVLYPDPMQGNGPLMDATRGDAFFVPVAVIDVTQATWRADVDECLERGCRALKVVPNYHQTDMADPQVSELAAVAGRANVPLCVQIRMMDERAHPPLMKVPPVAADAIAALAKAHPDVRFLACCSYQPELAALHEATNVWAEISMVESGQALLGAVQAMGAERLVFGSHSPFSYFEAIAAKLDVDPVDVSPADVEAVARRNARELLGGA